MPQIIVKGMTFESLKSISDDMIHNLSLIMDCPNDYFLLEYIEANYIGCSPYPLVEIKWFDRGQDIKNKSALFITQAIKHVGYENVEVNFTSLAPSDYFENGEQLG